MQMNPMILMCFTRDGQPGAWLISDTVRPVDVGWAYVEDDSYSPVNTVGWKVHSSSRGAFVTEKVG